MNSEPFNAHHDRPPRRPQAPRARSFRKVLVDALQDVNALAKEVKSDFRVQRLFYGAKHALASAILETPEELGLGWQRQPSGRQLLLLSIDHPEGTATVHVPFEELSDSARVRVYNAIGSPHRPAGRGDRTRGGTVEGGEGSEDNCAAGHLGW